MVGEKNPEALFFSSIQPERWVEEFFPFFSPQNFTMSSFLGLKPLSKLCTATKLACDALAPMVRGFYMAINESTSKLKDDKSVFTIADGIVQYLLVSHLFTGGKFKSIVGEEDSVVNISTRPYSVDDLTVPDQFCDIIDTTREALDNIAKGIDKGTYEDLTVFIDPIDGTREFSTAKGEQVCNVICYSSLNLHRFHLSATCHPYYATYSSILSLRTANKCSFCVGFASNTGEAVAGLV